MSPTKYISSDMKKKIQSFDNYKKNIKNFSHNEAKTFLKSVGALNKNGQLKTAKRENK